MLNRIKKWTWHGCAILSVVLMLICATGLTACFKSEDTVQNSVSSNETIKNDSGMSDYEDFAASLDTLPEYSGNPYIVVNDNTPFSQKLTRRQHLLNNMENLIHLEDVQPLMLM